MLIIGAKGFAKEVLEVFSQLHQLEDICFYDDQPSNGPKILFERFRVIKSLEDAHKLFVHDPYFVLGVGNPKTRRLLAEKMKQARGTLAGCISPKSSIGKFGNEIGAGVNIMTGVVITNDVWVGEGVLINLNCTIGHDVKIGDYCELSPGVHVSGNVTLGTNVILGTGAVVLPGVKIGDGSIVGAGSVVNKDLDSNVLAVGVPAKVIKTF